MSKLFSGEMLIANAKTCKMSWSCGKNGIYFRCGFCGHKFVENDKYRAIYTNDLNGACGNPLVCEKCNDTNDSLREIWKDKNKWISNLLDNEFWWVEKYNRD